MWVRKADYDWLRERVDKLEAMLETERAENRRVERHWGNMILRRGQSFPVPPPPTETPPPPLQPQVSASDRAKAQVVIDQGKAMNLPESEITDAVLRVVPQWTEAEVAAAIRVPVHSSNGDG